METPLTQLNGSSNLPPHRKTNQNNKCRWIIDTFLTRSSPLRVSLRQLTLPSHASGSQNRQVFIPKARYRRQNLRIHYSYNDTTSLSSVPHVLTPHYKSDFTHSLLKSPMTLYYQEVLALSSRTVLYYSLWFVETNLKVKVV